jgi:membrane-associated protease RseP (regulator of RpoE activity)
MLAAVAAGLMGLVVPPLSAQSGQAATSARVVQPRECAGECAQEKAERTRDLARAREELARLATLLAQRGNSLDPAEIAAVRAELTRAMLAMERLEIRSRPLFSGNVVVRSVPTASATISRDGWFGVSFSANFEVTERRGQPRLFRFLAYPVVESVEPASPARHAGVEVGDVLLAFNEKDLREAPIALDELLSPGTKLPVLLRRGDRTRTITVTIGQRPRGTYIEAVRRAPRAPEPTERVPTPAAAPAPPSPLGPQIWVGSREMSLAGAEMARLPGELYEQVGAARGLLVLHVPHGTPAARAGLREGDVIVSANGSAIRSSGDLQLAFRRATDRALSLEIVRQRQAMTVKMEW